MRQSHDPSRFTLKKSAPVLAILENLPLGIVLVDHSRVSRYVNPKFTRITGYTINDVPTGRDWLVKAYPDPEHRKKIVAAWKRDCSPGGTYEAVESRIACKDGQKKVISFQATCLKDLTVIVVSDTTARKQIESGVSLNARVARNRSGEIIYYEGTTEDSRRLMEEEKRELEARLRQSEKMEAIGKLAGGIAHDFNNILGVLLGHCSILKIKIPKDDPLQTRVRQVIDTIEKAASFTKSLLAFSKKQDVVLEPVRINTIFTRSTCILEGLLPKNIDLEIALDDEDVTILADISKIDQVMLNLITNARDAMPQGGKITIQSKRVTLDEKFRQAHGYGVPAEYVLITVADTGTGIEKDAGDKIFEPFYTTKKPGKGTGLGLAIVYGIVKQHNGYINVASKPKKGTTFHVYLPVSKTEKPQGSTDHSL